ncbi:HAD hydrolase-like protein [Luteolibacter pohnpeiensis]|uniref:phosphoglycolate phosphatase n=1 Tax=Luteolibacter pohnpeiensis TaxID=454153 RepID=A0A934S6T4_9BACT|nr:HAD family hydrolase [Luteolibacter pohnpeiensis]MBK1880782.1 HAD hydrolase-like protein [Luteolibacter pohnpeiensis]
MLYLFDIDGTLVDTGGAGMKALQEASFEIFGQEGPELDLAGSTDLGIVAEIHAHFKIESTPQNIELFFAAYLQRLDWNLKHADHHARVLGGAVETLTALAGRPDIAMGLLTGNIEAGAASKMRHFGLHDFFPFGAYGSDHADRNLLGPIAIERAALHSGRRYSGEEIWVIGDTPKDIACAKAIGAKSLAVATGRFTANELRVHHPDKVVDSLYDAMEWL